MKELQPVNQQVLLDISTSNKEHVTTSGIYIPETAQEKSQIARVISMSSIEGAEIRNGDNVVYKPFSGTEIDFEGKKYLIIPYADILAGVVETDEI
ncbi:MAG: co-chaperone GroES [Bacteroidales bacterium]